MGKMIHTNIINAAYLTSTLTFCAKYVKNITKNIVMPQIININIPYPPFFPTVLLKTPFILSIIPYTTIKYFMKLT